MTYQTFKEYLANRYPDRQDLPMCCWECLAYDDLPGVCFFGTLPTIDNIPDECVIKDDWMEYQEIFYKEIGGLM